MHSLTNWLGLLKYYHFRVDPMHMVDLFTGPRLGKSKGSIHMRLKSICCVNNDIDTALNPPSAFIWRCYRYTKDYRSRENISVQQQCKSRIKVTDKKLIFGAITFPILPVSSTQIPWITPSSTSFPCSTIVP